MIGTDIIYFESTWKDVNDTAKASYGTFKDLYASKKEFPDTVDVVTTLLKDPPAKSGTNATVFVVKRPLKPGKDKFTDLVADNNYTFVYALNTQGNLTKQHDYAGQWQLNITKENAVTVGENAKKMYASAAAVVSMAAISYLI